MTIINRKIYTTHKTSLPPLLPFPARGELPLRGLLRQYNLTMRFDFVPCGSMNMESELGEVLYNRLQNAGS